MAYIKTVWQDSPSTSTPLNAENLNNIEDGIEDVDTRVTAIENAGIVESFNSRTGAVTPTNGDYSIEMITPTTGATQGQIPIVDANGDFAMQDIPSSGHTIEDTDGNSMTQRENLQFVGVYTSDNQADDKTEVNIVRTMTKAQMDALSSAEKVGFIETSDEPDNPYMTPSADDVSYDNASSGLSATNVQDAIDELNTTAIPIPQITTIKATTDASGAIRGTSTALIGVSAAFILYAYIQKTGNLTNVRKVDIQSYGSAGYTLFCYDSDVLITNTELTIDIIYVKFT